MEMVIDFPGGARVDAHFGPHTVNTDQSPRGGGEGSAPEPFALFLASLGTCAGVYVLNFCRQRGLAESTFGRKVSSDGSILVAGVVAPMVKISSIVTSAGATASVPVGGNW